MENRAYIPQEAYLESLFFELGTQQSRAENISEWSDYSDRKVVQYELDFDREQARALMESRGDENFEQRVGEFSSFIEMQMVTALGERFNRGLSRYYYKNREGVLYGEHCDEPFLDTLERGRAYREKFGNREDQAREAAEVTGFQKIQNVLGSTETAAGTIVISVSPPGGDNSIYKHNFYDGFCKNSDDTIEVIRFSNALSAEETISRLRELDSTIDTPDEFTDVALLSTPIILKPDTAKGLTLEQIHAHLHESHEVMSEEDFAEVQKFCAFLIASYIKALIEDPEDTLRHAWLFNAILNKADEVADSLKENRAGLRLIKRADQMSESEVYYLGHQEVRQVDTGCGLSGGVEFDQLSQPGTALGVFSVASFGMEQDNHGSLTFDCPHCKYKNKRPYGKLIEKCGEGQVGGCGLSVRC